MIKRPLNTTHFVRASKTINLNQSYSMRQTVACKISKRSDLRLVGINLFRRVVIESFNYPSFNLKLKKNKKKKHISTGNLIFN